MSKVAIGICTYRRPEGLARLLDSLETLVLRLPDDQIFVVVADNSPDGSAEGLCNSKATALRFQLRYVNQKQKGLSNARNAAIAEARRADARWLAFIDDDEICQRTWLQALLDTADRSKAIVAAGPSYPLFAKPPDRWLPIEAYGYLALEQDGFSGDASSANMLIDLDRLQHLGFEFDSAFNETGGEDTQLLSRLLASGEKIAWSHNAYVWDCIPVQRMHPMWLFRRWYRTGITEARLTPNASTLLGRAKNACKGLARLGYGSFRVALGALKWLLGAPQQLIASGFTVCRGAGYLAGALGQSFAEYSNRRYR